MAGELTREEFVRRVRVAMEPPKPRQAGRGFAPGIGNLREAAGRQRLLAPATRPQLPTAR